MIFRKLPHRYFGVVMPFFLSLTMSCVVSAISVLHAQGTAHFLQVWPEAWAFSWIIAFPTVLVVLPLVRRLTAMVVESR